MVNGLKIILSIFSLSLSINNVVATSHNNLVTKFDKQLTSFSNNDSIKVIEKQIEWIQKQITDLSEKQIKIFENDNLSDAIKEKVFETYQKAIDDYQENLKVLFNKLAGFEDKKEFVIDFNDIDKMGRV
ncbi:hypothetical protein [Spiroplasma endosymbiont of Dilophus febrilis]|uniref:hypothetical protein n=1 Tax=Spiroplasma endosymbiont of Dilophus febrilis TaxID=3066292 RepID=UPI00313F3604